ncbi:MAG: cation:proton antiporter [bacterium]|nr:cation:proton antiporter [bacterium]
MGNLLLQDVLLIFLASVPLIVFLHYLKLPAMIGFILTGALIGPFGLGLIRDANRIEILAEIGVTLLLFSVGLEFSFSSFSKIKTYVVKGGILQILLSILVTAAVVMGLMDWSLSQGIYFGSAVALSSTAVVLSCLMSQRSHASIQGRIATGILVLQDLAVIPMVVFLPLFTARALATLESPGLVLLKNSSYLLLLFVMSYFLVRFFAGHALGLISRTRNRELFLITVISFAFGVSWMTHKMGLSFALGAFVAGLIVGNTEYRDEALSEITPFRYCFTSLFFVSIGMLLDFRFIQTHGTTVLLLILLIPLIKGSLITGILLLLKAPLRVALNVGLILGQIGEFSFLLATLGKQSNAISPALYHYIITAASVTMIITPLMIRWAPFLTEKISRLPLLKKLARTVDEENLKEHVKEMEKHVIISGFGPLGSALGHLLDQYKIPHVILELNPETIQKVRETNKNIYFGDGTSEEILYKSGIEKAKMLAITVPDFLNNLSSIRQARRLNKKITIITRSKYRNEVPALYEAGADIVISQELEGGIEMGRYALKELGIIPEEVDAYVRKIREFGSADFF